MPGFSKRYRPGPGDYGTEFVPLTSGAIVTVPGTATTPYGMGSLNDVDDTDRIKKHQGYVDEVIVSCITSINSASAVTINIQKREALTGQTKTLISGYDLKTALHGQRLPFLATVTDGQRTLLAGDVLYAEIVAVGAITVQPVALSVTALVALLK